jgi:hypothetical protein
MMMQTMTRYLPFTLVTVNFLFLKDNKSATPGGEMRAVGYDMTRQDVMDGQFFQIFSNTIEPLPC